LLLGYFISKDKDRRILAQPYLGDITARECKCNLPLLHLTRNFAYQIYFVFAVFKEL